MRWLDYGAGAGACPEEGRWTAMIKEQLDIVMDNWPITCANGKTHDEPFKGCMYCALEELAEKYVGNLGQEVVRLGRELAECRANLAELAKNPSK